MRGNPCALPGGLQDARQGDCSTISHVPVSVFLPCVCSWLVVPWAQVDAPALTMSSLGQEASHQFALPTSSSGGAAKQENFVLNTLG